MEIRKSKYTKVSIWLLLGCLAILVLGFVFVIRGRVGGGGPTGTGTGAWLSVHVFPDHQGWAVTDHDILHTTDDGQSWTNVTPRTSDDDFGNHVDGLSSFVDGSQAWLILPGQIIYVKYGQKQQPELAHSYHTGDGGKTWQTNTIPDTASTYSNTMSGAGFIGGALNPLGAMGEYRHQVSISSISAIDGQNAWVSVSKMYTRTGGGSETIQNEYSRIWRSSDGGKSWKLVMDQEGGSDGTGVTQLGWASFMNSTTGVMAGPKPGTILVSNDGGAHWTLQNISTQNLPDQQPGHATEDYAIFWNGQEGVIPVRLFTDNQHVNMFAYVTHDGAKTWQVSNVQALDLYGAFYYLSAQDWTMMPDNTKVLRTSDGGLSWQTSAASTGFAYVSGLSFTSDQEGWAIGRNVQYLQGDQYNQDASTTLIKTTDGGRTWTPVQYTVS